MEKFKPHKLNRLKTQSKVAVLGAFFSSLILGSCESKSDCRCELVYKGDGILVAHYYDPIDGDCLFDNKAHSISVSFGYASFDHPGTVENKYVDKAKEKTLEIEGSIAFMLLDPEKKFEINQTKVCE